MDQQPVKCAGYNIASSLSCKRFAWLTTCSIHPLFPCRDGGRVTLEPLFIILSVFSLWAVLQVQQQVPQEFTSFWRLLVGEKLIGCFNQAVWIPVCAQQPAYVTDNWNINHILSRMASVVASCLLCTCPLPRCRCSKFRTLVTGAGQSLQSFNLCFSLKYFLIEGREIVWLYCISVYYRVLQEVWTITRRSVLILNYRAKTTTYRWLEWHHLVPIKCYNYGSKPICLV